MPVIVDEMMFLLNSVPIPTKTTVDCCDCFFVIDPEPKSFFDHFTLEIFTKSSLKQLNAIEYEHFVQIYYALVENKCAHLLLNGPLFKIYFTLYPIVKISLSLH